MPKHEKPFHLDMPFDEVLRRYAQTDPREVAEREKKAKEKRKKRNRISLPSSTQPIADGS
jgi:hypothetical protein